MINYSMLKYLDPQTLAGYLGNDPSRLNMDTIDPTAAGGPNIPQPTPQPPGPASIPPEWQGPPSPQSAGVDEQIKALIGQIDATNQPPPQQDWKQAILPQLIAALAGAGLGGAIGGGAGAVQGLGGTLAAAGHQQNVQKGFDIENRKLRSEELNRRLGRLQEVKRQQEAEQTQQRVLLDSALKRVDELASRADRSTPEARQSFVKAAQGIVDQYGFTGPDRKSASDYVNSLANVAAPKTSADTNWKLETWWDETSKKYINFEENGKGEYRDPATKQAITLPAGLQRNKPTEKEPTPFDYIDKTSPTGYRTGWEIGGKVLDGSGNAVPNAMRYHPPNMASIANQPMLPAPTGDTVEERLKQVPTAYREMVRAMIEYRRVPVGGFATRDPFWKQALIFAQQVDPAYNEMEFPIRKKTYDSYASQRDHREIEAINTVANHIDVLGSAIEAMNNGNIQVLNYIANSLKVQTGKDPVTVFKAIVNRVGPELTRAYVGTGGEAVEREVNKLDFNPNQSPQQLMSNVAVTAKLLQGKVEPKAFNWKQIMQRDDYYSKWMTPEAKASLDKWAGLSPAQGSIGSPGNTGGQKPKAASFKLPDGRIVYLQPDGTYK